MEELNKLIQNDYQTLSPITQERYKAVEPSKGGEASTSRSDVIERLSKGIETLIDQRAVLESMKKFKYTRCTLFDDWSGRDLQSGIED